MESLSLLVLSTLIFLLFCATYLCGPIAALFAVKKWSIAAVVTGAFACWLGIYFFVTVNTEFRYLGLVSTGLGLWAMYKIARNIMAD
jgi:hypothetical protein